MLKNQEIKDMVKKLKEREERMNFTFRLSKALVEGFKKTCKKEGVSNSAVLEEFMKQFASTK